MRWTLLALILCSLACKRGTLCERFYRPYPDLIGDRTRTGANARLLDAMAAYRAGDYATAIPGLEEHQHRALARRRHAPHHFVQVGTLVAAQFHEAAMAGQGFPQGGAQPFDPGVAHGAARASASSRASFV